MTKGNSNGGTNTRDPFYKIQIDSSPSSLADGVVGTVELIPRNPDPEITSDRARTISLDPMVQKAKNLELIENNSLLRLSLKDWESRYKESNEIWERKVQLSLNVKNEIYQLIGFFSVFQGVVLTALTQNTKLDCQTWWVPFTLSLIVVAATLFGLISKFRSLIQWNQAAEEEKQNSKVLKSHIDNLKLLTGCFDFVTHANVLSEQPKLKPAYPYYVTGILVASLMLGFSGVILYACYIFSCKENETVKVQLT